MDFQEWVECLIGAQCEAPFETTASLPTKACFIDIILSLRPTWLRRFALATGTLKCNYLEPCRIWKII